MNVLKDYIYNWHKPFTALKNLTRNCYQRITRGWCDWDLYCYDDYIAETTIDALKVLEDKIYKHSGDRVDYRNDTAPLPIIKLCDELFVAREQLKASQDRTIPLAERQQLRDKAFKTISYYFDNLWW